MSELDDLRRAMRHEKPMSRRQKRAERTLARVLSPWRIGLKLASIPLLTVSFTVSIYVRTSQYEPPMALAHLISRINCDAARAVGLAPANRGQLGYHARTDPDGNGVSCEGGIQLVSAPMTVEKANVNAVGPAPKPAARMTGGAKFVKP